MESSNSGPVTELELLAFLAAARGQLGLESGDPVGVYHPVIHLEAIKNSLNEVFQDISLRAWMPGAALTINELIHNDTLTLAVNACLLWLSLHRDWSEWEKATAEKLWKQDEGETGETKESEAA